MGDKPKRRWQSMAERLTALLVDWEPNISHLEPDAWSCDLTNPAECSLDDEPASDQPTRWFYVVPDRSKMH